MCEVTHQLIYVVVLGLKLCYLGLLCCFWNIDYIYDVHHSGCLFCNANLNKWKYSTFLFHAGVCLWHRYPINSYSNFRLEDSAICLTSEQSTVDMDRDDGSVFDVYFVSVNSDLRLCLEHFLILCYSNSLICYISEWIKIPKITFLQLDHLITLISQWMANYFEYSFISSTIQQSRHAQYQNLKDNGSLCLQIYTSEPNSCLTVQ